MAGRRNKKHQLAPLQLEIMQVLWDREEATVAEVHQDLQKGRPLAYTTVSTMLTKMQRNGQVRIKRREAGRVLVYAAAIRESVVNHSMVGDLASRLFHGDVTQMVQHLLESDDVGPEELARLERLIQERKRR
jgi:predicted transcriptional regulator